MRGVERRRARVTVEIEGSDVTCGHIAQSLKGGRETLSYTYDQEYLRSPAAFALCPALPLTPDSHSARSTTRMPL